jgi:hypothetical protein
MPPWPEERWLQTGRELIDLISNKASLRWVFALEENEILFPQLKRPREQLLDRQHDLSRRLGAFLDTVWVSESRRKGVEDAQTIVSDLREQQSLAAYLHVSLQNLALGPILSKRPVPAPRDVSLVRLVARGPRLEFGVGQPLGRVAFAWRRLRYARFRPILQQPEIEDQRRLFDQLAPIAAAAHLPVADCWIQGEGQRMAAQILDAETGRGLWLLGGTPAEEIVARFAAWTRESPRPGPAPEGPPGTPPPLSY